ncbi:hypothetical protein [Amycolatopsis magusensis]|uniref:hypothetical protein n=1 Tax=Amycolatopsis magusensis TaxID=882444 RepID=UPI0037ABB61B
MSINFYAKFPGDAPEAEGLHIGLHVHGREFQFRGHRDRGLVTVAAWRDFLERPDVRIVDEYSAPHSLEEFWSRATLRPADIDGAVHMLRLRWQGTPRPGTWRDDGGHAFAEYEFC